MILRKLSLTHNLKKKLFISSLCLICLATSSVMAQDGADLNDTRIKMDEIRKDGIRKLNQARIEEEKKANKNKHEVNFFDDEHSAPAIAGRKLRIGKEGKWFWEESTERKLLSGSSEEEKYILDKLRYADDEYELIFDKGIPLLFSGSNSRDDVNQEKRAFYKHLSTLPPEVRKRYLETHPFHRKAYLEFYGDTTAPDSNSSRAGNGKILDSNNKAYNTKGQEVKIPPVPRNVYGDLPPISLDDYFGE